MAGKRNLGMGLDLLLSAVDGNETECNETSIIGNAMALTAKGINEDEQGNLFEAYYFYRRVIDYWEKGGSTGSSELCSLVSQVMNNLAVILFENSTPESALVYLNQAIEICPDNQVAKENLQLIMLSQT